MLVWLATLCVGLRLHSDLTVSQSAEDGTYGIVKRVPQVLALVSKPER